MAKTHFRVWTVFIVVWGLWLVLFDPFSYSPIYNSLRDIFADEFWGIMFTAFAILALYFRERQQLVPFQIAQGLVTVFWLTVFFGLVTTNWRLTSTPIYLGLTMWSLIVGVDETASISTKVAAKKH